jgi:hypothetical protein
MRRLLHSLMRAVAPSPGCRRAGPQTASGSQLKRLVHIGTAISTVLGSAASAAGLRQTPRVVEYSVEHRVACSRCSLDSIRVATLGRADDSDLVHPYTPLAMNSKGQFIALNHNRSALLIFEPDGRLSRVVGRLGEGPGELRGGGVFIAVDTRDSVYVVEQRRRVSVFGPTFRFARSFSLAGSPVGFQLLARGGAAYAADIPTPQRVGLPFHMVDGEGTITRSFGRERPVVIPGNPQPAPPFGPVLSADGASLYTWGPLSYSIDRWNLHGEHIGSIHLVRIPWLAPVSTERIPIPGPQASAVLRNPTMAAPRPNVTLLGTDTTGRLWLNAHLPYRDAKARGTLPGWSSRQLIEVVDPNRRQLLVSVEFPYAVRPLSVPGMFFANTEDASGVPQVIVWRLSLRIDEDGH